MSQSALQVSSGLLTDWCDSRLLAQHPDVLGKLRQEIASTVGVGKDSTLPNRNTLKRMKYLNLVLKEGITPILC